MSHFDLHAHSNKMLQNSDQLKENFQFFFLTVFFFLSSLRIFNLQHGHQNDTEFKSSSCIVSNVVLKKSSPNKKPAWKVSFFFFLNAKNCPRSPFRLGIHNSGFWAANHIAASANQTVANANMPQLAQLKHCNTAKDHWTQFSNQWHAFTVEVSAVFNLHLFKCWHH